MTGIFVIPFLGTSGPKPPDPSGQGRQAGPIARLLMVLGFAVPMPAQAGMVEDWNVQIVKVFQTEGTAPCLGSRHLAILHAAVHDAVNAWTPRYPLYHSPAPEDASQPAKEEKIRDPKLADLAGAAAAHEVLKSLAPARMAEFDQLLDQEIGSEEADAEQRQAVQTGRRIADRLLEERAGDGSSTTVHYTPQTALGQWRRTGPYFRPPEGPHWGLVRPFCLKSPSQFRAPAPPAPGSEKLMAAVQESLRMGGKEKSDRTEEQTFIARFWSDFSYTSTPPGHWNEILRDVTLREKLDTHQSARAFFLLNVALADAGIAVWDSKYCYNTWRPVTAIQYYGNPTWEPLLVNPPHPDYLSGHSGFSGAAAEVLTALFPNHPTDWTFTVRSDTLPGKTRIFFSFMDCARECSLSRVYGGIHFRHACEEGMQLGIKVGDETIRSCGLTSN